MHVVNHAAALAELAQYGYAELATKGLPAHHQHLRLWRTLPDVGDDPGEERPTKRRHDPRTAAYWQSDEAPAGGAPLTHRVKTLYGFDALVELIESKRRREEGNDKLRYLL